MRIVETMQKADWPAIISRVVGVAVLVAGVLLAAGLCTAAPQDNSVPSIFDSHSTPADSIRHLSHFVLGITGLIFLVVFSLLSYVVVKFRRRVADAEREPAQVYGSTQIELAWTIIPILIVVVLFLATARVIHAIQDAPRPAEAVEVTAIGHQFWWEFQYPKLGIVTANELHVPVSDVRTRQQEKMKVEQEKMKAAAEENKKIGSEFLEANKAKEGVVALPSGLQYKILTEGTGPKPTATDTIVCNYRGTLISCTEFDSSY